MRRTQLQLTDEQLQRLRELAERQGRSAADVILKSVDTYIAPVAAGRRNLSLVDCASFEVMRRRGLRTAFTLDRHSAEQGFETVP